MFGQPAAGFGGFGQQPQQSPFGAAPAAPSFGSLTFGQAQQAPAAFGAPAGGGMFGQQASAPAFGASAAPAFGATGAFGAQSAPAFGAATFGAAAPAFGASQPAFGASPAPAFGSQPFGITSTPSFGGIAAASSPAFGAASAPAFGAASAPAFGASFGTGAFGAASAPAFGATAAAPAFGASPGAFGAAPAASPFGAPSTSFGAAAPTLSFGATQPAQTGGLFGSPGGGFGAQQQAAVGTRGVAYQKTQEKESTTAAGGVAAIANYITITAMPAFQGKSQEELRFEDYQAGVKSAAAGPAPQAAAAAPSAFGMSPLGAFGTTQAPAAAPAFGTGAFGATAAPTFGSPASAPTFGTGIFGTTSTPAFGASSTPTFGSPAAAPAFGTAAPAFGTTAPAGGFGFGSTTPGFGQTQPATGLFGTTQPAQPAAQAPSIFGTTTTAAGFGAPAASAGMFSFASSSSFTSSQAAPAPAAQTSFFGTTPAFGTSSLPQQPFSSAASIFGSTTPAFGAKPATFTFNSAPASSPAASGFMFNTGAAASPGIFGNSASAFAPATTAMPGFGLGAAPTGGMFGQTAAMPSFGGSLFPAPAAAAAAPTGPPPSVGQAPYGSFLALPAVSEPKVGISARPVKVGFNGVAAAGAQSSPLLLTLRSSGTAPRFGVQVRSSPVGATPMALISATPGAGSGSTSVGPASSSYPSATNGVAQQPTLPVRANPHRLFIREPPPGTEAVSTSSPVLTAASNGTCNGNVDKTNTPDRYKPQARTSNGNSGHLLEPDNDHPHHNGSEAWAGSGALSSVMPRLGRLASEGYTFEPSVAQLQSMHMADPGSLKKVMNFTVTRPGVGQIRWLKPVDVTGITLDRIISIQEGEVYCYTDESKPPIGQGLNTDAEVSLFNVFKVDKETKQPIREGPAVLKWEKTLRAMCAKMGAKFVMYKADGGVWRFEVESF